MTNAKQEQFDRQYLRMAFIWSENSYAIRRKVGCIIVKDNRIISDGYNGTPSGFPNVCEYGIQTESLVSSLGATNTTKDREYMKKLMYEGYKLVTYPYVLHAEANAITKLARGGGIGSDGATIYITDSPCIECAKMIIQAGIRRVVYAREYRITDSLDLLRNAGIEIIHIAENDLKETNEEI